MGVKSVRDLAVREADLPALLEFHSPTLALTVEPVRGVARGMTWAVCSLAAACFAASALIPVDKVVTAAGKVVAQSPTSVVQPLETAIVRSIEVREGQSVRRGDLLARLDPTFADADAGALRSQVASLGAEIRRLSAEAEGASYSPADDGPAAVLQGAIFAQRASERAFKMEGYSQKIAGLRAQVQRAMSDVAAYGERLKVAAQVEGKRVELERLQVGSQLNRLAATDSRLEVKRGLDGATAQAGQTARDLRAMEAERDGYDQQWRAQVSQDLTEQGRKFSDAREQLAKADLRRRLVELRAPEDAVVLTVAKVSPGSVMQSGEQFLTLVPADAPLEVEVSVPGTEAGFVRQGDPVTVKFDTLPFTQYGSAAGTVRVVSPDSFSGQQDDRGRGAPQQQPQGPSFYRGRVALDEIRLHDAPPGFRVVPGMPVTADIKVGKRTLVSYLLSRVLPIAMDGMREP